MTLDTASDVYVMTNELVGLPLTPPSLMGEWRTPLMCQTGSFIYGYLNWHDKYDGESMEPDDCGVVGVELLCRDLHGISTHNLTHIIHYPGSYQGNLVTCPAGVLATGLRGKQGADRDSTLDQDGLINLEIKCQDGSTYRSLRPSEHGTMGNTMECSVGSYLCGVQIREVTLGHSDDNTCITDMAIICCSP
ncbi:hypothetical protein Pcinc_039034 [Petrolisthes cinctipes]|uniref:Uncharacterized protein n=1 Tax=Petrolisthes cinctipes TaxID=88211 RepID=A0AAE1EJQ4_PETCI|nr:hypothetical protein Pcinc_039034 [Petrolisthes cinctipes]